MKTYVRIIDRYTYSWREVEAISITFTRRKIKIQTDTEEISVKRKRFNVTIFTPS